METNEQIQNSGEGMIIEHQDVAESARKVAKHMVVKVAESIQDETEFFKLINKMDRASLTLQRLCSIITHIIPMEQRLLSKKMEMFPDKKTQKITAEDLEIILYAAKEFGLLKEGADKELPRVMQELFEQDKFEYGS